MAGAVRHDVTLLSEHDIYLFKEGSHFNLYDKLGSHLLTAGGEPGVHFAVWAPNASNVSVVGNFNAWDGDRHPLRIRQDESGIWEGFIPGIGAGEVYKYRISSRHNRYTILKGDPLAFSWESAPRTASIVCGLDYRWGDGDWISGRRESQSLLSPISIYEVHLGSWRRKNNQSPGFLNYRELAHALASYVREMGFTHVEILPVMEHPFYGSWGYQTIGYFAPTGRYGTPGEFQYLIDHLHRCGIGVILDWVPSHFPSDEHSLSFFDGTHLYEHQDPRRGVQPDWDSYVFNHGRYEVQSFLVSSALFWLDKYHADGIRVDAVASMLYLDYSRKEGEWLPNRHGGRENLEAIGFLHRLNQAVYQTHPDVHMIAEESTAWPMVSRPVYLGGLGFGMKWNMGWMHDTLSFFSRDPVFRKHHHDQLTFSIWYAFTENFMLPLSHDEVVHLKGSLIGKMPGDDWQKFANLRALFGYMFSHPGKKLLFMGGEFGQWREWNHDESLDWQLLQYPLHAGLQHWVRDCNQFYRSNPSLYRAEFHPEGFEWVDCHDWEKSIVSYLRMEPGGSGAVLCVLNLTPVPRHAYRVGVPSGGYWREILNSDSEVYGGSGQGNMGGREADEIPYYGRYGHSLSLTLPPLGFIALKRAGEEPSPDSDSS